MQKAVEIMVLIFGLFMISTVSAGTHEFYLSCADRHRSFVKVKYGDIDPGKEVARVSVAKKFAVFHENSCSVSDYQGPGQCSDCVWEEFSAASLSGDELARLTQGDPTVIVEVAVGVPLKTIENIGKETERFFKRLF